MSTPRRSSSPVGLARSYSTSQIQIEAASNTGPSIPSPLTIPTTSFNPSPSPQETMTWASVTRSGSNGGGHQEKPGRYLGSEDVRSPHGGTLSPTTPSSLLFPRHTPPPDPSVASHPPPASQNTIHSTQSLPSSFPSTPPVFAQLDYGIVGTDAPDSTPFWGWVLLACSSFMWIFGMHCIFLSNWVPDTGSEVLDWLKHDQYYCLMLPLLLPTTMFAVFWNWTGLKFFRHN